MFSYVEKYLKKTCHIGESVKSNQNVLEQNSCVFYVVQVHICCKFGVMVPFY